MESILDSIKKLLGLDLYDDDFNLDLILNINSALSSLEQIGVGPKGGFKIVDNSATWSDFLGKEKNIENVKTYVYIKTKLIFDPPQNSFLVDNLHKQAEKLEWVLNVVCDKRTEIDSYD